MTVHPYRPVALAVLPRPDRVEAAACQWCQWSDIVEPRQCAHPCHAASARGFRWCHAINPRGECPHFTPTLWTRMLRALRLGRAPAMVDPRVWEHKR